MQRPAECARAVETDLDLIDLYSRHSLLPALAGGGGFKRSRTFRRAALRAKKRVQCMYRNWVPKCF